MTITNLDYELLFDRDATLTISRQGGEYSGKEIKGLRIAFNIEKTTESSANKATIKVYNMGVETWSLFETEEDLFVILNAGYVNLKENLFVGNVSKANREQNGATSIVTIECRDGGKALQQARIDRSYAPGIDIKKALNDTLDAMKTAGNIVVGEISAFISGKSNNGLTLSGSCKKIIDKLCQQKGLEWSIQNNTLIIKDPDTPLQSTAPVISPQTGLIGSPKHKDKGIELTCLIQPNISPGMKIKVESKSFNDFFQVRKINYMGDTHDNVWNARIEAV